MWRYLYIAGSGEPSRVKEKASVLRATKHRTCQTTSRQGSRLWAPIMARPADQVRQQDYGCQEEAVDDDDAEFVGTLYNSGLGRGLN